MPIFLPENKMDQLLVSAASGMKTRTDTLDMLANNMANSSTTGYKTDREFYNLYDAALPMVERQYTDHSQGSLVPTGNSLDVAIRGKGFFALNAPSGIVYTRAGEFRISKGNQLETREGYTIRNVLDMSTPTVRIDVNTDGTVSQASQTLGQIEILQPAAPSDTMKKLGSTYYASLDKTPPDPAAPYTLGRYRAQTKLHRTIERPCR